MRVLKYDVLAASLILASGLAELSISEAFARGSFAAKSILGVVTVWVALVLAAAWVGVRRRALRRVKHCPEFQVKAVWFGPALVGISVAVWVQIVFGPRLASVLGSIFGPNLDPVFVFVPLITALIGLGAKLPPSTWSALRRVLCAAGVIFVLSQPVLSHWRAHDSLWPNPDTAELTPSSSPELQIFVLLDELNDKASGPIMAAMSRSGRPVHHRALVPVGDGTLKVVPALFSRTPYPDAKPCSINTICSGNQALDFSRIRASRPDIDVVGFFLPYCAIQGLRSCYVGKMASPGFSMDRWKCALIRRSEAVAQRVAEGRRRQCVESSGAVWDDLATDVEHRLWQAPVWRDGGVLFAHIPLPHPPSRDRAQGLAANYAANLDRAARLIGHIAETLGRDPSRHFSLVVFSDHPLRPKLWCELYAGLDCAVNHTMIDDRVPLLVTGDVPAAFGSLHSNQDVFELMLAR